MPRLVISVLCIAVLAILGIYFAAKLIQTPVATSDHPVSEASAHAVDLYLQKLESVGNTSLVLAGVAWAFLLKRDSVVRVRGFNGWSLFWCTNLSFLFSYVCYWCLYNLIVSDLYSCGSADLFAPVTKLYGSAQMWFFLFGGIGLLAIIAACRTEA
jgi:hypothetical protein